MRTLVPRTGDAECYVLELEMIKKIIIISFVLFPIIAVIANHGVISFVVAFCWILIVLPVCIMLLVDWYRENSSHNIWSKILRNFLRLPIALLGLFSVLMGAAMIVWVFYSLFIEGQSEYAGPVTILGGFGIAPLLIVYGCYLIQLAVKKASSTED